MRLGKRRILSLCVVGEFIHPCVFLQLHLELLTQLLLQDTVDELDTLVREEMTAEVEGDLSAKGPSLVHRQVAREEEKGESVPHLERKRVLIP